MSFSYWEYKTWLSHIDFLIVGSGIVGLSCAHRLRERFPKAKILILEKGILPQGASTKNAGFACFGSISEILADLRLHSEEQVQELVKKRWEGIQRLRATLGDRSIDFKKLGGHELFLDEQEELYQECLDRLSEVNQLLRPVFNTDAFRSRSNSYGFKGIRKNYISHELEGQLDTGKMMLSLLQLVLESGILVLNGVAVETFSDNRTSVEVKTNHFECKAKKMIIATNGFASQWIDMDIKPARAQVLVTKPIKNLHIRGTFHLNEGYYYFRDIDNRILFGGGRNLDFNAEETTEFGETKLVQDELERLLQELILPGRPHEIERKWSGIMGVGRQKTPIVTQLSDAVYCGVRLGGMGIAIGSTIGNEIADLV